MLPAHSTQHTPHNALTQHTPTQYSPLAHHARIQRTLHTACACTPSAQTRTHGHPHPHAHQTLTALMPLRTRTPTVTATLAHADTQSKSHSMPHSHFHLHYYPNACNSDHFRTLMFGYADAGTHNNTLARRDRIRSHTHSRRLLHPSVGTCTALTFSLAHRCTLDMVPAVARSAADILTLPRTCTLALMLAVALTLSDTDIHTLAMLHASTTATTCADSRSDTLTPSHRNTANFS
jgi:hypothetical protein